MENKKKKNIFLKIILILFMIYISLYLMDNLGYYNIATKNTVLTEEKLKEFENDIKNGEYIDIKEYTKDDTEYKNIYSNIGYTISTGINKVLNEGLKEIGEFLNKFLK